MERRSPSRRGSSGCDTPGQRPASRWPARVLYRKLGLSRRDSVCPHKNPVFPSSILHPQSWLAAAQPPRAGSEFPARPRKVGQASRACPQGLSFALGPPRTSRTVRQGSCVPCFQVAEDQMILQRHARGRPDLAAVSAGQTGQKNILNPLAMRPCFLHNYRMLRR